MWTAEDDIELIRLVYSTGREPNLPFKLFEHTFNSIIEKVEQGYGGGVDTIKPFTERHKVAEKLRKNINMFSGAKTFQNIKDLENLVLLPDGSKRPFEEFKKLALKINKEYDLNWLKTEQDAAFNKAKSAVEWERITDERKQYPFLEYVTQRDEKVRGSHKKLDGKIKLVTDKFWYTYFPPNDWGCRCYTKQMKNLYTKTKNESENPLIEPIPVFADNTGISNVIFAEIGKNKHPYFKLSKKEKDLQNDNNFQLGYL